MSEGKDFFRLLTQETVTPQIKKPKALVYEGN